MSDDYPRARLIEVDGHLVLDDPDALGMIQAIESHNRGLALAGCAHTFDLQVDRVRHYMRRAVELGKTPDEVVIVLLNVDDRHGGPLAETLMPGSEAIWAAARAAGQVPFARGLAKRAGIQAALDAFDQKAGRRLREHRGLAVVVVDHGVAEVFSP